jgi:hypothetical protein
MKATETAASLVVEPAEMQEKGEDKMTSRDR